MAEPDDASTWPIETLIVRGGIGGAWELAERRSSVGTWSVIAAPGAGLEALAASVRNSRLRVTTVGQLRAAHGWLRTTPGPPHHCDLGGLTASGFDAILGPPIPNPVPVHMRWRP